MENDTASLTESRDLSAVPESVRGRIRYSVVVPAFNEAESLLALTERVTATFEQMGEGERFELIFVNDGSTDRTPVLLREISRTNDKVRSVFLRRRSGKSLALMSGFTIAKGDIIITMDGDLQDRPEDIPVLVGKIAEGYQLVNGWRQNRQDQSIRKRGSGLFNKTVARVTGLHLHDMNCGIKAYDREVIDALVIYGQYHRYIPVIAHLMGFRVTEAQVSNDPRRHGVSKYRTFRYEGLFDLLSLMFTHRYGLNPMYFFGIAGIAIIVPSLAVLGYLSLEQTLYYLGFTAEKVYARPLLTLSVTALLLGFGVFLTGFVCDFILHHQMRGRIHDIVRVSIAEIIERGGRRRKPGKSGSLLWFD